MSRVPVAPLSMSRPSKQHYRKIDSDVDEMYPKFLKFQRELDEIIKEWKDENRVTELIYQALLNKMDDDLDKVNYLKYIDTKNVVDKRYKSFIELRMYIESLIEDWKEENSVTNGLYFSLETRYARQQKQRKQSKQSKQRKQSKQSKQSTRRYKSKQSIY